VVPVDLAVVVLVRTDQTILVLEHLVKVIMAVLLETIKPVVVVVRVRLAAMAPSPARAVRAALVSLHLLLEHL
jgi:hypothetical protein